MKQSPILILALSLLLAFILQTSGLSLAVHTPLWQAELNAQTYTINESSADILSRENATDGNTAPLNNNIYTSK